MYECKILADSDYWAPSGYRKMRLTTFQITAPRFILAEINTHRMLSRNSASSRAIPVAKSIEAVNTDPFVPEAFLKNIPGMQAGVEEVDRPEWAKAAWMSAADAAVFGAKELESCGVHKGWANRLLEPFKWHTMIITATDWSNFFALRVSPEAQPEFKRIATIMKRAMLQSDPKEFDNFSPQWHMPLVSQKELDNSSANFGIEQWKLISVGRCARVSYLTHEGFRDIVADIKLAKQLMTNGHLSPFEHVARPFGVEEWALVTDLQEVLRYSRKNGTVNTIYPTMPDPSHVDYLTRQLEYRGNLRGWHSARADVQNEHDFTLVKGNNV